MSGFTASIKRYYFMFEDQPFEVWACVIENAEAYNITAGQTPGEALRAMGLEFDDKFAEQGRGNWEPEIDVRDVIAEGELVQTPKTESDTDTDTGGEADE